VPGRLQAIGLPAVPRRNLFPYSAWLFDPTVPRFLRAGFILSCRVSPSEFLRRSSSLPLSGKHFLPGFRPSSRCHRRRPLAARVLRPALRSVLRFSQPLDGFRHLSVVRAYCIPPPRPGFVRSGVCSRPTAALTRRQAVPPCRCRSFAHRLAGCHVRTPRLRGFAPWSDAFLKVGD